ncbi:MAG: exo-alpha-sialidase [Planctomycetia bacterium]|nr:exo-alpha-sialidase [Planctomycetia bacterium]
MLTRISLLLVLMAAAGNVFAEPPAGETVKPRFVRTVVADGKHNAFTAMVQWRGEFWLAFRKGAAHNSGDGDVIVLRSRDAETWTQALRLDVLPDDRDPEFLATEKRLFLYTPSMRGAELTSYATYTDDGRAWSTAQQVYEPQYIFWKPIAHQDAAGRIQFFATAHKKAEGNEGGKGRDVHLISSDDGLSWTKVSTIRSGNWESETTIHFSADDHIVAFLREKYSLPGAFILEAKAPFADWKQREAGVHLSGHSVYTFGGVTYLFSRTIEGPDKKTGTRVYLYEGGKLVPYCDLPSGGDCSYPAAVPVGDEMLVSFYSSHEGTTNVYLAAVPLKKQRP